MIRLDSGELDPASYCLFLDLGQISAATSTVLLRGGNCMILKDAIAETLPVRCSCGVIVVNAPLNRLQSFTEHLLNEFVRLLCDREILFELKLSESTLLMAPSLLENTEPPGAQKFFQTFSQTLAQALASSGGDVDEHSSSPPLRNKRMRMLTKSARDRRRATAFLSGSEFRFWRAFNFTLLPLGMFQQLIVRIHAVVETVPYMWKTGFIACRTSAVVKACLDGNQLRITVRSMYRAQPATDLLQSLCNNIKQIGSLWYVRNGVMYCCVPT